MIRKLVSVENILDIQPIKGADRIEVATIKNWKVVVGKNDFKIGDEVVYFEIDSFLPIKEEFEFLRKSCYVKMEDGSEGFRLRSIRLRKQISQGLIMPTSILPPKDFKVGDDVASELGVIKYDPPLPKELEGEASGYYPSFIQKTDEERIQNLTDEYDEYKKFRFIASEKMDGTSSTFFLNDNEFGLCSRNLLLIFNPNNIFGRIAIKYNIEEKLRKLNRNLAIQGEIIGETIQGNKYKIKGQKLLVYNIFDIDKYEYLPKSEMLQLCDELELETVPTIFSNFVLPDTIEELLKLAYGISKIYDKVIREGLVWVSEDSKIRISFKTISDEFLLKFGE